MSARDAGSCACNGDLLPLDVLLRRRFLFFRLSTAGSSMDAGAGAAAAAVTVAGAAGAAGAGDRDAEGEGAAASLGVAAGGCEAEASGDGEAAREGAADATGDRIGGATAASDFEGDAARGTPGPALGPGLGQRKRSRPRLRRRNLASKPSLSGDAASKVATLGFLAFTLAVALVPPLLLRPRRRTRGSAAGGSARSARSACEQWLSARPCSPAGRSATRRRFLRRPPLGAAAFGDRDRDRSRSERRSEGRSGRRSSRSSTSSARSRRAGRRGLDLLLSRKREGAGDADVLSRREGKASLRSLARPSLR